MKKTIISLFILTALLLISCGGGNVSVPSAWNGDYALKDVPSIKVLTIHDGKIFQSVMGNETEIFPAEFPKAKYKMKSSANEVKAEFKDAYMKFTLNGDDLTQEVSGGAKVEYVKMK